MNRIDRLQAIVTQLQSKKVVTAQEIANRFEISLRTVYRDIRALEEGGIPIGSEAGVGYFLSPSYSLPPVAFTQEETRSLVMAGEMMKELSDTKMKALYESALTKVKAILREEEKDNLESLNSKIKILSSKKVNTDSAYLAALQNALIKKCTIEIEYRAGIDNILSKRNIEPIGLCNYGSQWHLIAFCTLRNDYRDFRVDRIAALTETEKEFTDKGKLTMDAYLSQYRTLEEKPNIKIQVPKARAQWIEDSKHWNGFVYETQEGDDFITMYFCNKNIEYFASWILGSGCLATILHPEILQTTILNFINTTRDHYMS